MRVVVDTNIFISGFFWGGLPGQILLHGEQERCTIISSEPLFAELLLVLQRSKFSERLQAKNLSPQEVLHNYRAMVEIVDVMPLPQAISDDPDDDNVLACAVSGAADAIVSGDDDLLRLKRYAGISILGPAEFLDHLNTAE